MMVSMKSQLGGERSERLWSLVGVRDILAEALLVPEVLLRVSKGIRTGEPPDGGMG